MVHGQGSLVLSDVTSRDTGAYTCRAMNTDDVADAAAYVRVIGTSRHAGQLSVIGRQAQLVSLSYQRSVIFYNWR